MRIFNIHYVKTQLSRLVEEAAKGQSFIIARAGKPMVKVTPSKKAETGTMSRLGFMAGECAVPDAFDQMGGDEIARLFGVKYGLGYEKYERVLRTSITFRRAPFDGHCGMKMLRTARQCLTYVPPTQFEQIRLPIGDHARVVEAR